MTGNMDKAVEARAKLPPGPWRIEPHASNPYNVHVVDAAGQNVITNCGRVFGEYLVAVTAALPHLGAQREEIAREVCALIERLAHCDTRWPATARIEPDKALEFADAILSLPTVQGQAWMPIETAPKDGTSVIVSSDSGVVGEAQFHEHEDGWWWAGFDPTDYVDGRLDAATHWMPLPPSPVSPDATLSAGNERLRNRGLPFVIEYRNKHDGVDWSPMAAFDGGLAARSYLGLQNTHEKWPWEYRFVDNSAPNINTARMAESETDL